MYRRRRRRGSTEHCEGKSLLRIHNNVHSIYMHALRARDAMCVWTLFHRVKIVYKSMSEQCRKSQVSQSNKNEIQFMCASTVSGNMCAADRAVRRHYRHYSFHYYVFCVRVFVDKRIENSICFTLWPQSNICNLDVFIALKLKTNRRTQRDGVEISNTFHCRVPNAIDPN